MSGVNPFTGQRRAGHYMRPGTRDSQKSKLYAAEHTAFGDAIQTPVNRLKDLDALRAYLARWTRAAWFTRRWGVRTFTVTHNGGKGGSQASGRTLYMATYNRNPYILAHELAHCLAPSGAGHGPAYARTYLDLVRYAIGKPAYDALKAAFKAHRVKVAPRKPTIDGHGVYVERATRPKRPGNPAALAAYRARKLAPAIDRRLDVALALSES